MIPRRPNISSVAPEPVRKLLAENSPEEGNQGNLAIQTVKIQLANHETRRKAARARVDASESRVPSLLDAATDKLSKSIDDDPEEYMKSMEDLPPNVLSRIALRLENMPYDVFCRVRHSEDKGEADEWILRNEVWLRDISTTSAQQPHEQPSKNPRGEHGHAVTRDTKNTDWTHGLVRLSLHADSVFSGSILTDTCRTITRPNSLSGFKILDGRRSSVIRIQPSVKNYAKTFGTMTDGLLKGLDWKHVFVAGGIALGALLCTNDKEPVNTLEQWSNSDVDLYIYGLGPIEANKKIEHIFSVFKRNLPDGAPVLVVRNSKTITFISKYPLRRIQVVLKLVGTPKDVLLNFDLDICAIGWNGEDVFMLPRTVRALETGYTVFTMDLINGHYLGDRRATQEERVFKYADKGYGIRILPFYLKELEIIKNDTEKWESLGITDEKDLDFEGILQEARKWTVKAIEAYTGPIQEGRSPPPGFENSWLQERTQNSEDPPSRSSLSGLNLFMRHVILWEYDLGGYITLRKYEWAASQYEEMAQIQFGTNYDETPKYLWDENFTLDGFISNMNEFNTTQKYSLSVNLEEMFDKGAFQRHKGPEFLIESYTLDSCPIQRITHAASAQEILQKENDIFLPLWLPEDFLDFADGLIPETVRNSGVPGYTARPFTKALKNDVPYEGDGTESLRLVYWRITSVTMWQQLNRAIDEVHEVLWSFHFANAGLFRGKEQRLKLLMTQFGRRAIRRSARDEFGAFARWVSRAPIQIYDRYGVLGYIDQDDDDDN